VQNLIENPHTSRQAFSLPTSQGTGGNRISMTFLAPRWSSAAPVYIDTLAAVSDMPESSVLIVEPFACQLSWAAMAVILMIVSMLLKGLQVSAPPVGQGCSGPSGTTPVGLMVRWLS